MTGAKVLSPRANVQIRKMGAGARTVSTVSSEDENPVGTPRLTRTT